MTAGTVIKKGRRGQPERLSKRQREILRLYARHGGFIPHLNGGKEGVRSWRHFDREAWESRSLVGYGQTTFYRSRQNLLDKGFLRPGTKRVRWEYRSGWGITEVMRGLELTEKAYDRMPEIRVLAGRVIEAPATADT